MLDKYTKNPGKPHWKGVKKNLRYLHGTKCLMLKYKKIYALLEIVGYSDSDFAGCLDIEKSTSGYIFTLSNGAISWRSSKQTPHTSLTMYTEFVSCYEASVCGCLWLCPVVPGPNSADSQEPNTRGVCPAPKSPWVVRRGPHGMAIWQSPVHLWSWRECQYGLLLSLVLFR
jgi:hypothetical protein